MRTFLQPLEQALVMLEDFARRLRETRVQMVMDQSAFAELGGVKKNSQIAYESAKTAPSVDYLLALERHGIDVCYVLTGRHYDTDLSLEQAQLFDMFERLSAREREAVMTMLSVLTGQVLHLRELGSKTKAGSASIHMLQQTRQNFGAAPDQTEEQER